MTVKTVSFFIESLYRWMSFAGITMVGHPGKVNKKHNLSVNHVYLHEP
jgi:hypothetical protein